MEQESASPLLQFWLTAENYYNQLSSPDHNADMEVDMSDAIAIYNRLHITIIWFQDKYAIDVVVGNSNAAMYGYPWLFHAYACLVDR